MKLESLEAIARVLLGADVRFVIVGGLAVNAHGYGRMTQDLDLVIPLDEATIRSAFETLASLDYRPRVPVTAAQVADPHQRERWIAENGMTVLNFHSDRHRETPIGMFVTPPFDFEDEYARSVNEELAPGTPIRIVSYPTLMRMKREGGRPQDLADVGELRLLHEDAKDG